MRGRAGGAQRLFKALDGWPLGQVIRVEDIDDAGDILGADLLAPIGDHRPNPVSVKSCSIWP
jgi:hypothetical protein